MSGKVYLVCGRCGEIAPASSDSVVFYCRCGSEAGYAFPTYQLAAAYRSLVLGRAR